MDWDDSTTSSMSAQAAAVEVVAVAVAVAATLVEATVYTTPLQARGSAPRMSLSPVACVSEQLWRRAWFYNWSSCRNFVRSRRLYLGTGFINCFSRL